MHTLILCTQTTVNKYMLHVYLPNLHFCTFYVHVDECITQGGIFFQWGGFEKSWLVVVEIERDREIEMKIMRVSVEQWI